MGWRCCGPAWAGVWQQSPGGQNNQSGSTEHPTGTNQDSGELYLDSDAVLDFFLLLMRVVAVGAHHLRLQHVAAVPVQAEEGAVQLSVFIW